MEEFTDESGRVEYDSDFPNPTLLTRQLIKMISEYINPGSWIPAGQIFNHVDDSVPGHRDQNQDVTPEDLEGFFYSLWEPFDIVAKEIPHDDSRGELIICLLRHFRGSESSYSPIIEVTNTGGDKQSVRLWQDMYHLGTEFWEKLESKLDGVRELHSMNLNPSAVLNLPYTDLSHTDRIEQMYYRNLMSYAARLTRDDLSDLSYFGQRAMNALLDRQLYRRHDHAPWEYKQELKPSRDTDASLCIASDWIHLAGDAMYRVTGTAAADGSEWRDKAGYPSGDWHFWIARLGEIVSNERSTEAARSMAKQMAAEMLQIQSSTLEYPEHEI